VAESGTTVLENANGRTRERLQIEIPSPRFVNLQTLPNRPMQAINGGNCKIVHVFLDSTGRAVFFL
jgi:hypothetical protein